MLKNSYIILMVLSSFFVETCTTTLSETSFYQTKSYSFYSKKLNIAYGNSPTSTLDIFLPKKVNRKSPLVVLIHGGAWCFGEKETLHPVQEFLAKHNIPSANLNYRLNKGNITYKDQLHDIHNAISFLKKNADSLKIPTNRIILFGESAGAHLSLLYGYRNPSCIEKIISLAAPTDFFSKNYIQRKFYHWYTKFFFELATGGKYDSKQSEKVFKEASPIANISHVPTLILQGTNDIVINKSQALTLDSMLTVKQVPHKLVLMKGGIHISRRLPWLRDKIIYPEMLDFLKAKSYTSNQVASQKQAS